MIWRLYISDAKDMEFIELKIDMNNDYHLADFYLYVTTKDGKLKRQNIFPAYQK